MTSIKVVVWGGGRWALNYLKSLDILSKFHGIKVTVISKNKAISSLFPKLSLELVSPSNITKINNALNCSSHSLILNKNLHHARAIRLCMSHEISILCEKPLCIPIDLVKNIEQAHINSSKFKFWESMLPRYCYYLYDLLPLVPRCSDIYLEWMDPLMGEKRNSDLLPKKHDTDISYIEDIIPHSLSILNLIDPQGKNFEVDIFKMKNNSGKFRINGSSFQLYTSCSRQEKYRIRQINGLKNEKIIFTYEFPEEPGSFTYIDQDAILANTDIDSRFSYQQLKPISLQLIDFLNIPYENALRPQRPNLSFHKYKITTITS